MRRYSFEQPVLTAQRVLDSGLTLLQDFSKQVGAVLQLGKVIQEPRIRGPETVALNNAQ